MSILNKTKLKTFFNRLEDRPLDPALDADAALYEPYLERQPEHDPIRQLATRISWSEAASVNLLSGQRGSGKSTELRRLRKYLQEEEGCVVLMCDMRDYLNLTKPVEVTDFFISLMVGLNLEIRRRYNQDPGKESYWERLIGFLQQEVKIKDLTLEGELGSGKIGINLQTVRDLAIALAGLADVLQARNRPDEARPLYAEALALWQRLHRAFPENREAGEQKAMIEARLAKTESQTPKTAPI
jgi:energy-coupling factor transporter ATP-binding protein EcfA2